MFTQQKAKKEHYIHSSHEKLSEEGFQKLIAHIKEWLDVQRKLQHEDMFTKGSRKEYELLFCFGPFESDDSIIENLV